MIFRSFCAFAGLSALIPAMSANTLVQTRYEPRVNLIPATEGNNAVEWPLTEFFEVFPENPVATFTVRQPVLDEVRRVRIGERLTSASGLPTDVFRTIQTYRTTDGVRYMDIRDINSAEDFEFEERSFTVRLLPDSAPLTVANFITYARRGDFDKGIIHRNLNNFIMQGGLFRFSQEADETTAPLWRVQSIATVPMEEDRPNAAGTLAMARPQQIDGATSSWFFNVSDNTRIYAPNALGPYAVFGEIEGDGLQVVRDMNRASGFNISPFWGGEWSDVPLTLPFNTERFTDSLSSLVRFESITVSSGSTGSIEFSPPAVVEGTEESPIQADPASFVIDFDSTTGNLRIEAVDTGEITLEMRATAGNQSGSFRTRFLSADPAVTNHFPGAVVSPGNQYTSPWFGRFNAESFPWIFHPDHHFLFAATGFTSYFFFDARLGGWVRRSQTQPDLFFIFGLDRWARFAEETGHPYDASSPMDDFRWFYLFDGDNSRWVIGSEMRALIAAATAQ
ncbi:MAG: peptidylprolyl isomerase [Opitutales bacterium]|nr:peptidylprolyl isomerase [Opitutales bacterium]